MKVAKCDINNARRRLIRAKSFLDSALLLCDEYDPALATVAVAISVLAGIAASDAICCVLVGQRSASSNHADAVKLVKQAPLADSDELAKTLQDLLAIKQQAHYGDDLLHADQAKRALRRAQKLVARAQEIVTLGG